MSDQTETTQPTTLPMHYVNFASCKAVQFPQEVADLCKAFQWSKIKEWFAENWEDHKYGDRVSEMSTKGLFQVFLSRNDRDWSPWDIENDKNICFFPKPGQWMVIQGSKHWVQDEEPPNVKSWEFGAQTKEDYLPVVFDSEEDARDPGKKWLMGRPHKVYKRPIVVTGPEDIDFWIGNWSLVD